MTDKTVMTGEIRCCEPVTVVTIETVVTVKTVVTGEMVVTIEMCQL